MANEPVYGKIEYSTGVSVGLGTPVGEIPQLGEGWEAKPRTISSTVLSLKPKEPPLSEVYPGGELTGIVSHSEHAEYMRSLNMRIEPLHSEMKTQGISQRVTSAIICGFIIGSASLWIGKPGGWVIFLVAAGLAISLCAFISFWWQRQLRKYMADITETGRELGRVMFGDRKRVTYQLLPVVNWGVILWKIDILIFDEEANNNNNNNNNAASVVPTPSDLPKTDVSDDDSSDDLV
eukprot:CAMPEP_0201507234 /NCGR_PEP_ID=MMETSP0161_2-20130828/959_1 /ASSEMBLY_ACC=CAM_ASM_000251 /TAXON_ID=180227 /ORGANISM="Neoparamoeba aestuarina, Strain SoJaBio B1-5/56/2" /LENGTH=234 /DNA_ID=CAMNT_0047901541 /DNA_START=93 /DNA_END=797 /DNA_ORIENTATION=+